MDIQSLTQSLLDHYDHMITVHDHVISFTVYNQTSFMFLLFPQLSLFLLTLRLVPCTLGYIDRLWAPPNQQLILHRRRVVSRKTQLTLYSDFSCLRNRSPLASIAHTFSSHNLFTLRRKHHAYILQWIKIHNLIDLLPCETTGRPLVGTLLAYPHHQAISFMYRQRLLAMFLCHLQHRISYTRINLIVLLPSLLHTLLYHSMILFIKMIPHICSIVNNNNALTLTLVYYSMSMTIRCMLP